MKKKMEEIVVQCVESLHQLEPIDALSATIEMAACIIWQSTKSRIDAMKAEKVFRDCLGIKLDGLSWDDITEVSEPEPKATKKKQKAQDKTLYS